MESPYSKLQNDADFIGHTNKYLLFGLVETNHTASDIPQMEIQGYRCFQVCRKKFVKGPKSGGICVYYSVSENHFSKKKFGQPFF